MKIYINFKTFFLEIIIFILGLFVLINDVIPQTQYYHQLIGTNTASSLYYNINSSNLGIGTTSPSAMLHIRSTNFATQPLFQIDIVNGYSNIASVKSLYTDGTTNFGICQTSTSGGLINYFQDPVRINNMTLYKGTGNRKSQISTDPYVNQFDFIMTPCDPSCDPVTPLTVNSTGIIVRSHLVTGYFQLLTNPGVNKILVSDSAGNGNWTDPSMLSNNFWSNNFQDVHLNFPLYQKVGIGTSNPIDRFQVNDGIGKVSLGSVPDSLLSGTGYIGFNAAHHLSGWMFSGNSGNNGGGVIY